MCKRGSAGYEDRGKHGGTWHTSLATALPAADLREVPAHAWSLAEQVNVTLFLAALTSTLFLHSLLECEEQEQGPETVRDKILRGLPVDLNFSLTSA